MGWRKIQHATKRKAVEALKSGETYGEVSKRFKVGPTALKRWKGQYEAGQLGTPSDEDSRPAPKPAPKAKTPERLFDDRVQKAIVMLREAGREINRMMKDGEILEEDEAHLLTKMALRTLQGRNAK